MSRARNLHALYVHLTAGLHFMPENVSDILRSELVYVISSLDKFIHDIVRQGMIETFIGQRVATNAYKNFQITLDNFEAIKSATLPPPEAVFERTVVDNHKHLSFQDPEKISSALSLIWNESHKWQRIATGMGRSENNLKIELKNILLRRNQIVHEADIDLMTGKIQVIRESDVLNSVDFVEQLGNSIYALI